MEKGYGFSAILVISVCRALILVCVCFSEEVTFSSLSIRPSKKLFINYVDSNCSNHNSHNFGSGHKQDRENCRFWSYIVLGFWEVSCPPPPNFYGSAPWGASASQGIDYDYYETEKVKG